MKTLLFGGLLLLCTVGALLDPVLGILGYMGHYCVGPDRQWWAVPINRLGIRYSYTLALVTAVGIVLNWRRLRFGRFLLGQEKLMLLFLGVVWLALLIGEQTVGRYTVTDHPSVKLAKVTIFALMLSHVVTDLKRLDWVLWVLVVGTLILGLQAYDTPRGAFMKGRLETIGGPDFSEANVLPAFLSAMLPLVGIQFLRSGWVGRAICLLSGAFAANAIVLTRSRGALVGLAVGAVVAAVLARRRYRTKILVCLVIAALGGLYLTDAGFRSRARTISRPEDQRDASAQSRLEIWKGGLRMVLANPLGVGPGNFHQSIGRYAPRHSGRDAHNTFVRCAGDLGVPGIAVLVALIVSAFRTLKIARVQAETLPQSLRDRVYLINYGLAVGLVSFLGCGLTITLVYNEALWWLLVLPVCSQRAVANLQADLVPAQAGLGVEPGRVGGRGRPRLGPRERVPGLVPEPGLGGEGGR